MTFALSSRNIFISFLQCHSRIFPPGSEEVRWVDYLSWEMEISTWRQRHPTPISSKNPTVSKYLQVWSFSILSPPCAHSNTVNLETSNTWIWNERNNRSTTQDLVEDQVIFQAFNEVLGICSMMTAFFFSQLLEAPEEFGVFISAIPCYDFPISTWFTLVHTIVTATRHPGMLPFATWSQ